MVIYSSTIQNIGLTLLGLIWVILSFVAFRNGIHAAQSSLIISNLQALQQGLVYFYNDQDRYPTTGEFASRDVLGAYFNKYPPRNFVSGLCPQTYTYEQAGSRSYRLFVCVPVARGGFVLGSNDVSP